MIDQCLCGLENIDRVRDSLLAQLARIRAGTTHATIKGTSLEIVVRRTLREHVPGYFKVGSGQIANRRHELSPQLDILVYDHTVFPHLAVNEDSSVVIPAEALFGTVECKARWDRDGVQSHFARFSTVESHRNENYAHEGEAAAYYVMVFETLNVNPETLAGLADTGRFVGVYSVEANMTWISARGVATFRDRAGNALGLLLKDILLDCMQKGQKDVGTLTMAYAAVREYINGATVE